MTFEILSAKIGLIDSEQFQELDVSPYFDDQGQSPTRIEPNVMAHNVLTIICLMTKKSITLTKHAKNLKIRAFLG